MSWCCLCSETNPWLRPYCSYCFKAKPEHLQCKSCCSIFPLTYWTGSATMNFIDCSICNDFGVCQIFPTPRRLSHKEIIAFQFPCCKQVLEKNIWPLIEIQWFGHLPAFPSRVRYLILSYFMNEECLPKDLLKRICVFQDC